MSLASPGIRTTTPTGDVVRSWAGALTDTAFQLNADVVQFAKAVRVVVSANSDLSSPIYTSSYQGPTVSTGLKLTYKTVAFTVTGLSANTKYYYQYQFQDAPSQIGVIRSVTTAPTQGVAAAFRFVVGSCSQILVNTTNPHLKRADVFRAIEAEAPLFYVHLGDMIYSDLASTDVRSYRDYNARLYRSCLEADILHRSVPMASIPSDHDYGGSDISLQTTDAVTIMADTRTVYGETVPHYAFIQDGLLTQTFDIGKVRFLMPDCHAQRNYTAPNVTVPSPLTALGRNLGGGDNWDQLTWFGQALTQAQTDGIKLVVFLCEPTWSGGTLLAGQFNGFGDTFLAERQAICDLIEACSVPTLVIAGDAHAIGFGDGTNCVSTDGFAFFPEILASALYQDPSSSSGPYTWNGSAKYYHPITSPNTNTQMYVVLDVAADGTWTAKAQGSPIDPTTFAPTTLGSVSSTDVTPAVSFNSAAPSVAHGVPLTVNLDKTWFGACSVTWTASTGQAGTATFLPNKKRATFSVTFANAGSPTITLSSPSGCTISGTNPATVTVT